MFKSRYRFLYILLLAVYSYLNIKFTEGDQLLGGSVSEVYLIVLIGFLVLAVWESNRLLFNFYKHPLEVSTPRFLIIGFLLSWVHVVLFSSISAGISSIFHIQQFLGALKLSLGFVFRVNLFLHCVNAIIYYQQQLQQSKLDVEIAQKTNVLANYNALKRQVSPHFLFNSLNVLDELIAQDQQLASKFLSRLSKVYRYVTRNQAEDLVSLKEEIEFIKSYIYLIEIRYRNLLIVKLNVDEMALKKMILPAALQLLIENTIKHNEVSSSKKLVVTIWSDSDYLIVENPIQPKISASKESLGVGLQNIIKRYEFFIDKKVIILNDGSVFRVKLPLLTSE